MLKKANKKSQAVDVDLDKPIRKTKKVEFLPKENLFNELISVQDSSSSRIQKNLSEKEISLSQEKNLQKIIADLQREVSQLNEEKIKSEKEIADLENMLNRYDSQIEFASKETKKKLIYELLKIIDELERAYKNRHNIHDVNDFHQILQQNILFVHRFLDKMQVKPIEAKGKKFDPKLHKAQETIYSDQVNYKIVIEEIVKGYLLNNNVIRETIVKVAIPKDSNKKND